MVGRGVASDVASGVVVVRVGVAAVSSTGVVIVNVGVESSGGGPPKAPVTGVSGGGVKPASSVVSGVGLARKMILVVGAADEVGMFAAASGSPVVPNGTPATKKPIVSSTKANAYPVRERTENGKPPRRARAGD